jgi:hypothetical protein
MERYPVFARKGDAVLDHAIRNLEPILFFLDPMYRRRVERMLASISAYATVHVPVTDRRERVP